MKWSERRIKEALKKHKKWLDGDTDGARLDCHDDGLEGALLDGASLIGASLNGASLDGASLDGASLDGANLFGASLIGASLDKATLFGASLIGASLIGASLNGASLIGASLDGASLDEQIKNKFYPLACPAEGDFVGWKKAGGKIIKLLITGQRSSAYGRKCRCDRAKVLSIENEDGSGSGLVEITSDRDKSFIYRVGETVTAPNYDTNRWNECSTGIHFFITRQEAVDYN